jgi:hypothetical protein
MASLCAAVNGHARKSLCRVDRGTCTYGAEAAIRERKGRLLEPGCFTPIVLARMRTIKILGGTFGEIWALFRKPIVNGDRTRDTTGHHMTWPPKKRPQAEPAAKSGRKTPDKALRRGTAIPVSGWCDAFRNAEETWQHVLLVTPKLGSGPIKPIPSSFAL